MITRSGGIEASGGDADHRFIRRVERRCSRRSRRPFWRSFGKPCRADTALLGSPTAFQAPMCRRRHGPHGQTPRQDERTTRPHVPEHNNTQARAMRTLNLGRNTRSSSLTATAPGTRIHYQSHWRPRQARTSNGRSPNTYTYGYGNGAQNYSAYGYGNGYRNRQLREVTAMAGPRETIVRSLHGCRSVHSSLARIDHDYQGHRVRAMHAVSMAIRQLSHRSMGYSGSGFSSGMNNGRAMGMRQGGGGVRRSSPASAHVPGPIRRSNEPGPADLAGDQHADLAARETTPRATGGPADISSVRSTSSTSLCRSVERSP